MFPAHIRVRHIPHRYRGQLARRDRGGQECAHAHHHEHIHRESGHRRLPRHSDLSAAIHSTGRDRELVVRRDHVQAHHFRSVYLGVRERDDSGVDLLRALLRHCVSAQVSGDQVPRQAHHMRNLGSIDSYQLATSDCHCAE